MAPKRNQHRDGKVLAGQTDEVQGAGEKLMKDLAGVASTQSVTVSSPEEIFRLYAMFVGDLERTAIAANLPIDEVADMATAGQWHKRIAVLIKLQQSGIPGDTERGVNRAINFIQAEKLRTLIERILTMLVNASATELVYNLLAVTTDKEGNTTTRIVTRPFADLATALEKAHAMTYQALNDTATDRKDRRETDDKNATAGEMHMALVDAFAKVRAGTPPVS